MFLRDASEHTFAQIYDIFVKETLPNQKFEAYHKFPVVKIGSICEFSKGNTEFNKDFISDEGLPFLHYSQIQTQEVTTITATPASYIAPQHCECIKNLATAQKGDIIVTDASIGMPGVCLPMVWDGEQELITSQHCIHMRVDQTKVDPFYLAYYLKSYSFFVQKRRIAYGSGIFSIYAKDIAKCTMRLPPLAVQKVIGDFLLNIEILVSNSKQGLKYQQKLRNTQIENLLAKLIL